MAKRCQRMRLSLLVEVIDNRITMHHNSFLSTDTGRRIHQACRNLFERCIDLTVVRLLELIGVSSPGSDRPIPDLGRSI